MGPRAASRRAHLALDLDHVGDVGDAAAGGVAGLDRFPQRRLGAADHRHGGAGSRERGGDRAADAASAAGHESVLASERRARHGWLRSAGNWGPVNIL